MHFKAILLVSTAFLILASLPFVTSDRVINIESVINEFLDLDDTPSSYTGADQLCLIVNETLGEVFFGSCSNASGAGDITGVTAGDGLTGGGDTGTVTLNVDLPLTNQVIVHWNNVTNKPAVSGGKAGDGIYLYNNSATMFFNETLLNLTIDDRASGLGDNSSWNQTFADTLYAAIGSGGNTSWNQTFADTLYAEIIWGYNQTDGADNSSWNQTFAVSLFAPISVTGDNSSWNQTHADTLYAAIGVGGDNSSWNQTWANTLYSDIIWGYNMTDGADNSSWNQTFANTLYAPLGVGGDNSSWNQTHADTLYADISVTGDNVTWNENLANTLYAEIIWGYNQTIGQNGTLLHLLNITGVDHNACSTGNFINNVTFDNGQILTTCDAPAGSGDITKVQGDQFITNGSDSGDVWLAFNSTLLNATIAALSSGGNASWNQSHADTLYADISVTGDNSSWNQTHADTLYADISVTGDNSSWNQTHADTLYSDIIWGYNQSDGSDNSSWNQTHADTLYAAIGVSGDNSSWNQTFADTLYADISLTGDNSSWNQSWANTLYAEIQWGYNQTDGSDNSSWNQTFAVTLFAPISVTGDNSSWNQTHADTLYADISVTGDNSSWNQSWADTLYADIVWGYNFSELTYLEDILNPNGDKTFTMGTNTIVWSYSAPTDNAFEIEGTGGFAGDLLHLHQHTGNPGPTNLLNLEAEDVDVLGLNITTVNPMNAIFNHDIDVAGNITAGRLNVDTNVNVTGNVSVDTGSRICLDSQAICNKYLAVEGGNIVIQNLA